MPFGKRQWEALEREHRAQDREKHQQVASAEGQSQAPWVVGAELYASATEPFRRERSAFEAQGTGCGCRRQAPARSSGRGTVGR